MRPINQNQQTTLARQLSGIYLDWVGAAAGQDFSHSRIRWFPPFALCTILVIAYTLERLPNVQTPITPLPNGPHAIAVLLAGYGILNLFLAFCVSSKAPRLILGLATAFGYTGMLGVHYAAGPAAWHTVFAINLLYALSAFSAVSYYLSGSRFKSVFLLQILVTLVGVQGPLALLNLVPFDLLQTVPFAFDGWILFGFPIVLLLFSPAWAMFGFGIRIAFLLLLPPILIGYSFVHLSQTLAIPSLSVLGLGGSGLLLVLIVRILILSLREKKARQEERSNTPSQKPV